MLNLTPIPRQFISEQPEVVQEYFTKICNEDKWKLDLNGFFQRTCDSIQRNEIKNTCEFYNLDEEIVSKIVIKNDVVQRGVLR